MKISNLNLTNLKQFESRFSMFLNAWFIKHNTYYTIIIICINRIKKIYVCSIEINNV